MRNIVREIGLTYNYVQIVINHLHPQFSCRHGLQVSLGFFHDVHIPAELLQQPAHWNEASSEWSWTMNDPDTPPLFYTRGQEVRFKVHAVRFHQLPSLAVQAEQRRTGMPVEGTPLKPHVPMEVVGRVDSTGLGMIAWAWG